MRDSHQQCSLWPSLKPLPPMVMDSELLDFSLGAVHADVEDVVNVDDDVTTLADVELYVRSSPQRMETFKKCVEKERIKSKQTVCLDVCTRWNSSYLMLEVAIKFEKAFQRMGEEDNSFIKFFGIKEGDEDLSLEGEGDQDATKKFSASLFVTSNVFFHELLEVETRIDESILSRDPFMSKMAIEMKRKFETYWGDVEKFNPLLYMAEALDPRYKLRLVKFCYTRSKGKAVGEKMEKQVKDVLNKLYDSYEKEGEVRQNVPSASSMPRVMEENEDCDRHLNLASEFDTYLEEYSSVCSSEVDKYLGDLCERRDNPDFDILVWWSLVEEQFQHVSNLIQNSA
ncbi:hypothetical protein RHSIM_Rhsim13G0135300 [Rhododendron simsii]|uniref:hAT-like transposase RNase-H fold domain-containing protein n=1 Tax=Rhododendron simsii TaxID=118357 RepID=A0A834FZW6_RHOSS|nr:hypothetical protein RHSIM_Rhsim13G0135300 [Rhododendron simsii]